MIRFQVVGLPSPQAGMRAVNTVRGARMITTGGPNLRNWRNDIATAAHHAATEHGCMNCPLYLTVTFRFPMPKTAPKHDRQAGRRHRTRTPDLDKLLRAVCDGLTSGGLIADDSLIVIIRAEKIDVHQDWTGADITLGEAIPL